jgi:hypothetical protein
MLETRARRLLCAGDALDGFAEVAIEDQHGGPITSLEVVEDVLRSEL